MKVYVLIGCYYPHDTTIAGVFTNKIDAEVLGENIVKDTYWKEYEVIEAELDKDILNRM